MLQNCLLWGCISSFQGGRDHTIGPRQKNSSCAMLSRGNLLSLIIFRALPQSWSFPEATSGKMVISSWTRWRFSSDISANESHRRSVCSSCSYPIVWFNCSGTSNDTCCAVVHLTCVSDSFGCLCCGVGPMPDGNGEVIVQLMSSTCSVEASGIVSGVTL